MNRTRLFGALLTLALVAPFVGHVGANGPTSSVLFEWNQILQDSFPTQGVGTFRPFSMTHIAMFDAINAIERDYEPYFAQPRPSDGGSPEAAAAQAAHDVLVGLNPTQTAVYDAALARQIGTRPSGHVRRGAAVGARVAQEILAWRQNDGWVVTPTPAYSEPPLPGRWQPTPPARAAAAFTHLQFAAPMALLTATQFLPPPPPSLTSTRYATDLNEIKAIGKSDSSIRTAEQTVTARVWNGVAASGTGTATNFLSVWNNIVRDVVQERHLSLVAAARVFVLVNVSMQDSLMTTQASKFVYGLWRPVTAIQQADTDLNAATDADPGWMPLLVTPPYPSYAGNMATIGAGAARALQLVFRTDDIPVTVTWKQSGGQPDVTHQFSGFWEVAEEQSNSRMWGGIHYRFDQEAGQNIAKSVAEYAFNNYVQRRSRFWD